MNELISRILASEQTAIRAESDQITLDEPSSQAGLKALEQHGDIKSENTSGVSLASQAKVDS